MIHHLNQIPWGITLDDFMKAVRLDGIEVRVQPLDRPFARNRDMMLVEWSGMRMYDITVSGKFYFDKEFDTFHYSLARDLEIKHQIWVQEISNDPSLTYEEKKHHMEALIQSELYQQEEAVIHRRKANVQYIRFEEYRLTLGIFFFDEFHHSMWKELLTSQFGESEQKDEHNLWNIETRIELAPTMLTWVPGYDTFT